MAFGQAAGPPAGGRQVEQLAVLFERAGFSSFREARHPYGLTQRQAAGKFTAAEAEELIERLEAAELVQQGEPTSDSMDVAPIVPARAPEPAGAQPTAQRRRRAQRKVDVLGAFADDLLVAELEERGWCCIPPISTLEDEQG